MRDAFGGTAMLYIIIIFIVLYVTFVAVAFSYAKAFRAKNRIIDYIEQHEGIRDFNNNEEMNDVLYSITSNNLYDNKIDESDISKYGPQSGERGRCLDKPAVCIVEYNYSDGVIPSRYYRVTTFLRIELPIFKLNFTVPVQGETRKIDIIR